MAAAGLGLAALAAANASGRRAVEFARREMAEMRVDLAAASLAQAGRAFPTEPEGLELRARVWALNDQWVEAQAVLPEAIATSPRPAAAMRLLGNILVYTPKREGDGLAYLRRGLDLTPPPPRDAPLVWVQLGMTALRARDPATAAWAFLRSQEAGPATHFLASGLEDAYKALGLVDAAAAAHVDPALRHEPASAP